MLFSFPSRCNNHLNLHVFMSFVSSLGAIREAASGAHPLLGGGIGLIIGSHLATILVRWPLDLSANHGRSRCDQCLRQLHCYELVPIVSFVSVRGRCSTCRHSISLLHPLVEAGCGMLGAYFFGLGGAILAPLGWLLLLLVFFDARTLWLPDPLVAVLALVCGSEPAFHSETGLGERVLGGVIGFSSLWLLASSYRRLTGRDGLGGGDAKLFGALGLWLGARDLPLLMVIACGIGLLDVAARWQRGAVNREVHLPLGAYLCVAALGFAAAQPFFMAS